MKFSPEQYPSYESLPKKHKKGFKEVEGGFVNNEVLSEPEAYEHAFKIRERLEKPEDWERAKSFEEASLMADADIAQEELSKNFSDEEKRIHIIGFVPETDREKEAIKISNKIRKLERTAEHVRYLNDLENKPEDVEVFIDQADKILTGETYKLFSKNLQEKFLNLGGLVMDHGSYFTKLRMIEAYGNMEFPNAIFGKLKNDFIKQGDFDLYKKLFEVSKKSINKKDLIELGKQSLQKKSPHDAERAFEIGEDNELLEKARLLEIAKSDEAKEKEQKMPNGFMTKNLMSHSTSFRNLPDVLLGNGILSGVEMQKRGIKKNGGYGNDLQYVWGAFDYISAWDPWSGFGTRPDHARISKDLRRKIEETIKPYAVRIDFDTASEEEKKKLEDEAIVYYKPWGYSFGHNYDYRLTINEKLAADPHYADFFEKINKIFEEAAEAKEEPSAQVSIYEYDYHQTGSRAVIKSRSLNPLKYFDSSDAPILLIDPDRKRFITLGSGFGPESFVKTKITPNEIVGLVLPAEIKDHEDALNWFLKLAKQSGTPLYLSESVMSEEDNRSAFFTSFIASTKTADTQGQYKFEKIWPKS